MLRKRIVVCLDVDGGRVVKGVRFRDLREVGEPVESAARYERDGADEIVFLDISASTEGRRTLLDLVRATAERLFIPLTVGGGIGSVRDVDAALRAGADKVAVNTAAVRTPALIGDAARRFGSQCVVVSIDAAARDAPDFPSGYEVVIHGGRTATGIDALAWGRHCAALGAGEILLTAVDRDGRRDGYDVVLTRILAAAVAVPVVASGGAGCVRHFTDVLTDGGADAALAAGIFHDGTTTVAAIKRGLARAGILVRRTETEAA